MQFMCANSIYDPIRVGICFSFLVVQEKLYTKLSIYI
jgi:hypothetical protein